MHYAGIVRIIEIITFAVAQERGDSILSPSIPSYGKIIHRVYEILSSRC